MVIRPRTQLVKDRKTKRCSNCGTLVRKRQRCKRCNKSQ